MLDDELGIEPHGGCKGGQDVRIVEVGAVVVAHREEAHVEPEEGVWHVVADDEGPQQGAHPAPKGIRGISVPHRGLRPVEGVLMQGERREGRFVVRPVVERFDECLVRDLREWA
jgi:hypothetical protein